MELGMNRRGDVPTVLIIPVSFVLILLALFSFLTISGKLENSSKDISQVIMEINFYEGYVRGIADEAFFESISFKDSDLKKKYQEICRKRELQIGEAGNFFGKIRTGDFVLEKKDEKYIFEVKGLFVKSERKENKMKREFDIKKEFYVKKEAEKPKSECKVQASGGQISDYYSKANSKAQGFALSIFWQEDEVSDIIGSGMYPRAGEAFPKATDVKSTLDSLAISKGAKITFYSQKNFKGEILLEGAGPLVIYNRLNFPNGKNIFDEDVLNKELKELYQSEFPPSARKLSDSDMHNWAKSIYRGSIITAQGLENVYEYAGGSVKIECL